MSACKGFTGVLRLWPYLLAFCLLWYFTLLSGVHATVAGVLAAFAVPVKVVGMGTFPVRAFALAR